MQVITKASQQWASRPADERYTSLYDMQRHFHKIRDESYASAVSSRKIEFQAENATDLSVVIDHPGDVGGEFDATHHSFEQICSLVTAPAGYLRSLDARLVADNLNYGLKFKRDAKDTGILVQRNGHHTLRAATGPNYGRIWNADVVDELVNRFGDGVTGDFRVPGEFGKAVTVNDRNTTLYASDRDMFVFLADETNRIEISDRRDGKSGSLARGFYIWNSEVGDKTLGIGTFLFDYVCMNRTIWGVQQFAEVTVRHTAKAPDRFLEEIKPTLIGISQASDKPIKEAIKAAQDHKLGADVNDFMAKRFGRKLVDKFQAQHMIEEGRPIESRWDVSVAVTAYARGMDHQDSRVNLEREAGKLLDLAA